MIDPVEDAQAQGGPSEDLKSIPVSFATNGTRVKMIWDALESHRQLNWVQERTLTPTDVDMMDVVRSPDRT